MSAATWVPGWRRRDKPRAKAASAAAPPAAPALPAPGSGVTKPPAAAEPLPDEFERLVDELRDAVRTAGVARDDPMMPLLAAFAHAIRAIGSRTAGSDRIVAQASQRIADALVEARAAADAERRRFEAQLAATEAQTIGRVADAIARSSDDALARRIRVFDRNSARIAAFILFAGCAAFLGGGYYWGNSHAYVHIHQTEAGLQAAFSNDADGARLWLDLMTWNNIPESLRQCLRPGARYAQSGRKACNVPLWIEEPLPPSGTD